MRKQSVEPITLDGRAVEQSATLHSIHAYMEESLTSQAKTEKTMKEHTKKLSKINESVEEVKQQFKEATRSHVAKRIIREQLQQERYEKAHVLAKENVQLTTDDCFKVEKMVEQIGENARKKVEKIVAEEATKRETTQVMRQITSYIKRQLKLRSIEDIPNGLVDQHKVLLQGLTRKKLDTFMKKGGC
ncbi:TPA: hypothetical protein R9Y23_004459 [Bacillus cereus]|nr:hypothetical protein [Bacillus cereus]HEF1868221.1 hypothetical protein [Bacillus cereus]HEF1878758.1 hypothetical protein [Bacillus cereus]HEF1884742.1 hypothetical protein [Bacillus cereus]